MYSVRICIQSIYLMWLSLTIVNVNMVLRSGGSKCCLIRQAKARVLIFETQQPQIYTLNADSDIIHMFLMWHNSRLCSFTNRRELCADSLRGLLKLGKWLCFCINLSLLTPGLSTSSSTPYEHHISHSHPYRMASQSDLPPK